MQYQYYLYIYFQFPFSVKDRSIYKTEIMSTLKGSNISMKLTAHNKYALEIASGNKNAHDICNCQI